MKAITYLMGTTLKNNIKELKRQPAKLILYLFLLAMLGLVVFSSTLEPAADGGLPARSRSELGAMVLALYAVVFVVSALKGLSSGASFYSMADVALLFPSPVSNMRILIYGLVRQAGLSLLVGFFLFFQYGWLSQLYAVTIPELLYILVGYGMVIFCGNLTAMVIYSFSSGSDAAKARIRIVIYAVCALAVGYVAWPVVQNQGDIIAAAATAADSPLLALFPVAGWVKAAVGGAIGADILPVLLGLAAAAAYVAVLLIVQTRSHSDFYEDVLQATSVAQSAITAKKEGRMQELVPKNVKTGRTGLGKGRGARAFFYKHLVEDRRGRILLLDRMSLLFLVISILFSYFMRDIGLIPILVFTIYMQIFSTATGRWVTELTLPFIYLVPASPFRKLLWVSAENVMKIAVESVVTFVAIGVVIQLSAAEIVACVLLRISFGLLFMAGNFLIERIIGGSLGKTMVMMIYFLMLILLCLPGVAVGVLVGVLLPGLGMSAALFAMCVWNTAVAVLITFLCRNILDCAELNNK